MVRTPDERNRNRNDWWAFPLCAFLGIFVIIMAFLAVATRKRTQPSPTPTSQAECAPCDVSPQIGSLLQHIEKVNADGQDWYVFQCAGWEYGTLRRSAQELLITFDPAQKEPSPRCWISKPQTEQRITTLHLEFASPAQLQNMLNFSSVQH